MKQNKKQKRTFFLNGKKAGRSITRDMMNALNSPSIRTEKGGYLFKSLLLENQFYLGILPSFHQGDRTYHYQIEMPQGKGMISGVLNPEGIFTLLIIEKQEFSESLKEAYRKSYQALAEELLAAGLNPPGPLDDISCQLIKQLDLFPNAPGSLQDLLESPAAGSSTAAE